jgi:hypothetical protein
VIAVTVAVGVAADLDARPCVLEHHDRRVEGLLRGLLDRVLVDVEVDALDDAAELGDGLRDLVGAAVGVLVAVLALRLLDALVVGVEDAVAVRVGRRAAVGRDTRRPAGTCRPCP